MRYVYAMIFLAAMAALISGCIQQDDAAMPNPAAKYCINQGHRYEIRMSGDGSQSGYCIFGNGNGCDEWAFYRNECSQNNATGGDQGMAGGDADEHGCIGSAGYSWCESKNECLRIWEEDCPGQDSNDEARAVDIAREHASLLGSTILSDEKSIMTVKSVKGTGCDGCFIVELQYDLRSDDNPGRVQKAIVTITIEGWIAADTKYSQTVEEIMTDRECISEGGYVTKAGLDGNKCSPEETSIGEVEGHGTGYSCCLPGSLDKTFCTAEQRGADVCTMEYRPVCGWFGREIQCIRYPCAGVYSNPCMACSDEKVEYWTEGECPSL